MKGTCVHQHHYVHGRGRPAIHFRFPWRASAGDVGFFFLWPARDQLACSRLNEHTTQEASEASLLQDAAEEMHARRYFSGVTSPSSLCDGSTLPMLEAASWKRWMSQDFLETRSKIQQLLEHHSYMTCLLYCITVKIFRLLPTRHLVVLKCIHWILQHQTGRLSVDPRPTL